MTKSTAIALSPKDRFEQIAREEMVKFERREGDLRKSLRADRARELSLPVDLECVH